MPNRRYRQILVLYHDENREKIINEMVRDIILREKIADSVYVGELYETLSRPYIFTPDLMITILPRDFFSTAVFTYVKTIWECYIVSIPTEGFFDLSEDTMHKYIGFNETPALLIDKYVFFGKGICEAAEKQLKKYNKIESEDQTDSFGYLFYEKNFFKNYIKQTDTSNYIHDLKKHYKKIIIFVLTHMGRDLQESDYYNESSVDLLNEDAVKQIKTRIKCNSYYSDKYIEMIYKSSQKFPDYLFIVKKHPVEASYLRDWTGSTRYDRLEGIKNIVFVNEPDPVSLYFELSDIMVNYGSTTAMEAYIYGLPVVHLLNDHPEAFVECYGAKFPAQEYVNVSDFESFAMLIEKDLKFRITDELESELESLVNYSSEEVYEPSVKLGRILIELPDNPLQLSINDPVVKKIYQSKEFNYWQNVVFKNSVKDILKLKISDALKGIKFCLKHSFIIIRYAFSRAG